MEGKVPGLAERRVCGLEHDVARLDVAVEDPLFVGIVQRPGDATYDVHALGEGHDLVLVSQAPEPGMQGLARDKVHHDVQLSQVLPKGVHFDDAGVVESGDGPSFLEEPRAKVFIIREMRVHHLDRHIAIQGDITSPVDSTHSPLAQELIHPITIVQRLAEKSFHVGHPFQRANIPEQHSAASRSPGQRGVVLCSFPMIHHLAPTWQIDPPETPKGLV